MDKKIYKQRIAKYQELFLKVVEDILNEKVEVEYFSESVYNHETTIATYLFVELLQLNIIKIEEAEETKYDRKNNILKVNSNDDLEYVDFIILKGIISNILDEIKLSTIKAKALVLFEVFYKRGLINLFTNKLLIGSDHIIISNLTRLFIESNR